MDVDGSWGSTFNRDWLYLRNDSGRELTNCTLIVRLKGAHLVLESEDTDSHIHFIARWPSGKVLYAPYPSRAAAGIATNESVDYIESLSLHLYADQLTDAIKYTYIGNEFDKDVERYANEYLASKIAGRWYNYPVPAVFNNGLELRYDGGLAAFPLSRVTIEAQEGTKRQTLWWKISSLKMRPGFVGRIWLSDSRFNGLDPDKVQVTLGFPKSRYERVITISRK